MRTTADIKNYKKVARPRGTKRILDDIRIVIESTDSGATCDIERQPIMLFWQIGKRIREELRRVRESSRRKELISMLAKELAASYGKHFAKSELKHMIEFGNKFSDARMTSLLSQNLNWQHFLALIPIRDSLKRNFYAEMCRMEQWSPTELRTHIKEMLYETTKMNGGSKDHPAKRLLSALQDEDTPPSEFIYDSPDILEI